MTDERVGQLREIVNSPPPASGESVRRVMVGNRRRDSAAELRLRSALHRGGLRFRVDHPIRVGGARPIRPDVVFPRLQLAVFVDGCFWHGCREHGTRPSANSRYWEAKIALNQERDQAQEVALHRAGWTVLRVWEHEPTEAAVRRVKAAVYAARATAERSASAASTD